MLQCELTLATNIGSLDSLEFYGRLPTTRICVLHFAFFFSIYVLENMIRNYHAGDGKAALKTFNCNKEMKSYAGRVLQRLVCICLQSWAQITYQKRNDILTSKSAAQNAQYIFVISEALCNFRNELFDSVEAQRNSAIAEWHFRTKLKHNLTSAIEFSQHNANTAFFAVFDRKG